MQSTGYDHFKKAALLSFLLATLIGVFLLIYGKDASFFVINKYYSPEFDYFFRYYTYLGNGIIWVPLFVYVIVYKRDYFIAFVSALIICTFLTQFLKHVIFPNDFRPIVVLTNKVRTIPGLHINTNNSFPSGHTSTAFTLALLLAFVVKRNFWVYFFPVVAFFVGYSRVYLAQHFVADVFAGVFIGIISSYLSLLIYEYFRRQKERKLIAATQNNKK